MIDVLRLQNENKTRKIRLLGLKRKFKPNNHFPLYSNITYYTLNVGTSLRMILKRSKIAVFIWERYVNNVM